MLLGSRRVEEYVEGRHLEGKGQVRFNGVFGGGLRWRRERELEDQEYGVRWIADDEISATWASIKGQTN